VGKRLESMEYLGMAMRRWMIRVSKERLLIAIVLLLLRLFRRKMISVVK
jgi:hypothetical protein